MKTCLSSKAAYLWVAAIGAAGCAAMVFPADAGTPAENPFALSHSGLPHRTSLEGDQATWRVQEDIARELIERVFREEGVVLNPAHAYEDNEIAFQADGFDPGRKIGYVLAGPGNLEPDALIDWLTAAVQRQDASPELVQSYLETMRESLPENLRAQADAALRFTDVKAQQEAIQYIRGEMWRQSGAGRKRLSLEEARALERKAAAGEEFIAVISHYDPRFTAPNHFVLAESKIRKKLDRASKVEDRTRRREKTKKIVNRAQEEATKAQARASHEALARLEATTREYILWARTKGLE